MPRTDRRFLNIAKKRSKLESENFKREAVFKTVF